jgi:hypothetical protein
MNRRTCLRSLLLGASFVACDATTHLAAANPPANEAAVIDRLIARVAAMNDMVFIRNGSEAPADTAAQHLRDKYQYFRDEIVSAEDFIRLCGTRSEVTHEPYRVRFPNGRERPASEVLHEELRAIRRQSKSG